MSVPISSNIGSVVGVEVTEAFISANYLNLSGSNANQPIDLQGQDVSNVSAFTATNSVLAPNIYVGDGSPTGHIYQDVGTGNFDIAYYGGTPFVGWNVTSSTPYFGSDPTVNGYGVNYSSSILYVTANGGAQSVGFQVDGTQTINGDSEGFNIPLSIIDACTLEDGSTASFKVHLSSAGIDALEVLNNGDVRFSNSTYQFYGSGYGYIGAGIAWDTNGRFRTGGGDPLFAYLEAVGINYTHLLLGYSNSVYTQFNVASTGGMTLRPSTNTTQGFNFQNSGGSSIVNIDTTNPRVGIGGITTPLYQLHTSGDVMFGSSNSTPIIRLGGNTSSHVALKRSSTTLQCILANDAGSFAAFSAGTIVANSSYLQAATGVAVIGNGGHYWAGAASYVGWTASNNASFGATPDVTLSRNAAGILQIGTTAMGATGSLYLAQVGSSSAKQIYNASTASVVVDYDINASSTANNTFIRLGNGTISTATTGVSNIISSTPSINQSGTAGYTAINLNVTETATGSGAKNLAKWAVGGTTMFNVSNTGATTIGSGSNPIEKVYKGTATLDFPSIAHNSYAELTLTVTNAAAGDYVQLAPPAALEAGLTYSAKVSSANTVTIILHNCSGGSVDPASATWGVTVTRVG